MLLKSIDVLGFKSFPDKIRLEFSNGITALLGPNGCGKSNVVDAVKWALGEQSSRALRADKMEDIIFNGTEIRKALNVAEITLIISNDEEELPLDVPEISIKRRLYRSGESEYFINNTPVRLRDIRELFFGTGVGKSAYSIMEQGEIDQILSTKPEDRRSVFEEAAGITKYRVKGVEAERKLERTRENMRQVEGILGEVRRTYNTLKRQAERTEKYRDLNEQIFQLELDVQLLRLKSFQEQRDRIEEKLQKKINSRNRLKKEIDAIKRSIEQNIEIVNSIESRVIENQKKLYQIDLEKRDKVNRIKILRERIGELERKITSDEERERVIRKKLLRGQDDLQAKIKELKDLNSLLEDVKTNIQGFELDVKKFEVRIHDNESEISHLNQISSSLEGEVERLRIDLRHITDDIVTQLDRQLKELGYSAQDRKKTEKKINSAFKTIGIQLTGRSNLLEDHNRVGDISGQEEKKLLTSTLSVLREVREKIEILSNLFKEYTRYTPVFLEEFLAPEGIITRKREIDQKITDNLNWIVQKRNQLEELRKENKSLSSRIAEYRQTLEDLRVNHARMNTQKTGIEIEIKRLEQEISEQEASFKVSTQEIDDSQHRLKEIDKQITFLSKEKNSLEQEDKVLKKELSALEGEIAQKNEAVINKEQALKTKAEKLEQVQLEVEKLQIKQVEIKAEIRNLYNNFSEMHSRDLAEYESRMFQIEIPLKKLNVNLSVLKKEVNKLGQVNLMAPEEFAEVSERYQFLSGQLNDLRKASDDLKKVTQEIRSEYSELFLETYNAIKKNFHIIFHRLFGGGRAELKLLDPSNILESGIEILAQPSGKKLENIALLSVGEKSLTAIALLFATYMVKPSPFCVLDEIDAALDEQNVIRFVHLLKEFSSRSQFIVITHNKKTVASADTLLGITMEESGVSKIISLKLENKVEEKTSA